MFLLGAKFNRSIPVAAHAVFIFFLISSVLLLNPVLLFAEQAEVGPQKKQEINGTLEPEVDPEINVPGFGGVNASHKYLSSGVEKVAQRIDMFFGEDRIYEEATRTYLQARGSVIYGRGGEFEYDGKFRAKVDLPQLKRKANLVFESDDEGDSAADFDRIASESKLGDELQDQDFSAALQIVFTERERWNFSVRPGVKLSDPIETFIKLRFRRNQPVGEKWLSRGTVEVGFYSERGWENEYKLDFERDVGSDNFFRSTSTVLWREDFPGNQLLGQAFQLTHFIDRRQLVSFEVSTSAETRPNLHDMSYFSSIRYRRNIHRGWLFLEIKPQVTWERVNDFEADPALVLSLEVLFGAKHL
jgi:hypothetical protein